VIATNGAAEWRPFDLPIQVWISTVLIILSSVTYHLAKNAFFEEEYDKSRKAPRSQRRHSEAAFISSQILVWLALVNRGFYMRGNPYAGFFYILTAVHAIHVAGGIVALGTILLEPGTEHLRKMRSFTAEILPARWLVLALYGCPVDRIIRPA
jgi:cytochrome c oxidase subunit 3